MKLSILIPVYNESVFIEDILKKINNVTIPNVTKELIVIDDSSTDGTDRVLLRLRKKMPIQIITHKENQGKGAAVRTGLKYATGEYILIHDADLEYNPNDISRLIEPILSKKANVVFGSRLDRLPNLDKEETNLLF